MKLWIRFDEEDLSMVHFSAQPSGKYPRRLLATVHVDDMDLLFGEGTLQNIQSAAAEGTPRLFCSVHLNLLRE